MADDFDLVKISELPAATTPGEYDVLAGVQTGDSPTADIYNNYHAYLFTLERQS